MCGIVGAISTRNVSDILVSSLKRLEYRGYDSSGIAVLDEGKIHRHRQSGKIKVLEDALKKTPVVGNLGIIHTRWATHGLPLEHNAHPHMSGDDIAVVHNGIIENYEVLRQQLIESGYNFNSETDTEIIGHLIHYYISQGNDLIQAVNKAIAELEGAFALGIISRSHPNTLIAVRQGSPLVIGITEGENFIASDHLALLPLTRKFIYLEDGDVAELHPNQVTIYQRGVKISRDVKIADDVYDIADKGKYRHHMLKEIFEQPHAVAATLEGRLTKNKVLEEALGKGISACFDKVKRVQIVACGTSYHAGLVARYWLEETAGVSCDVEIASEFRYRKKVVEPGTLFIAISQSGETADTLYAVKQAKENGYLACLAICNVAGSSLVREADFTYLTKAGIEIGVASTKAFTTQLTALLFITLCLARRHQPDAKREMHLVEQLHALPTIMQKVLECDDKIQELAIQFINKQHTLFLGRGTQYPVALEGALKLKEISYIHAEAYAAGELKHGPLALVDRDMPIVAVAPNDELLEKLKSNLQEVQARGGQLFVFADKDAHLKQNENVTIIPIMHVEKHLVPIIYTIPLQLLAYHVAVLKGTDIDQPRNLAKSVTVE